jgi:hypothetical protein
VRFIWRRLKNLGAPPSARWGHAAVSIGSGAMVVFGGCGESVDLGQARNPTSDVSNALDDCYVFHLGGVASVNLTTYSESVDEGEGLWVRVPGECGLGRRVCPSAAVTGGAIIIFGGCRGKNDPERESDSHFNQIKSLSYHSNNFDGKKQLLKDARVVDVEGMLTLDLVGAFKNDAAPPA